MGNALYGDDLTDEDLAAWFTDEEEAYFRLYGVHAGSSETSAGSASSFGYSEIAEQHVFRWLPRRDCRDILGIGCADGAELAPLLPHAQQVTILEPSDGFAVPAIGGTPVTYVKPNVSGAISFQNALYPSYPQTHHSRAASR